MSRIGEALEQIEFVRNYTLERVNSVDPAQWFTIPPGGVSNIAWQVGHIAFAEYRLCLERLRPRTKEDQELMSDEFIKVFGRDSLPETVTGFNAHELKATFNRVHNRVLEELPGYPDADLDLPPLLPHPLFHTRLAGLRYAPLHEMIHCGQIALIRRMLGHKPIW